MAFARKNKHSLVKVWFWKRISDCEVILLHLDFRCAFGRRCGQKRTSRERYLHNLSNGVIYFLVFTTTTPMVCYSISWESTALLP